MPRSRSDWKSRAALSAAALVVALAIAGAASAEDPPPTRTASGWSSGAETYDKVCAYCHDTGVGPALRGRKLPPILVNLFVRNGSRAMPSFRAAEIDDEALAKLADFLSQN